MTAPTSKPTALIVGASRGLGLAMVEQYLKRGWRVVATVRNPANAALRDLGNRVGDDLEIEVVDIADEGQINSLRDRLAGRSFDLLFVNAGISNDPAARIGEVSTAEFVDVMVTNALGPLRVVEAFATSVPPTGTIGVMSSGLGSLSDNENGSFEVYRASKAALNMLMKSFATRNPADPRAILIIVPGWVRTDMGGPEATLGIDESVPRIVDVILAQRGKPGIQYLNYLGETVRW